MSEEEGKRNFWVGNALLVLALVILLNMGQLWEQFGALAMVVWVAVAGLGGYYLMNDGSK
jgi:hypothetical protein